MHSIVHRIAARQHGVVGRHQLLAEGISPRTIDTWVARGALERVTRGVYRTPGAPLTPLAELRSAQLRCRPGARVVGPRVLAGMGVRTLAPDGPFTVLTKPGRTVTGIGWTWRTDPWHDRDAAMLPGGICTTTPARNLLELAVDATDAELETAVDGCRWRGRILPAVRDLLVELPTHPGARRLLRSDLLDVDAAESRPERDAASVLVALGAEQQGWLSAAIRVDFLFRTPRLVYEYDGEAAHGGGRKKKRDAGRDAAIRALGFAVEHIRAADLRNPSLLRRRAGELVAALTPPG